MKTTTERKRGGVKAIAAMSIALTCFPICDTIEQALDDCAANLRKFDGLDSLFGAVESGYAPDFLRTAHAFFAAMRLAASLPRDLPDQAEKLAATFRDKNEADGWGPDDTIDLMLRFIEERPAGMSAEMAALMVIALAAGLVERRGCLDPLLVAIREARRNLVSAPDQEAN